MTREPRQASGDEELAALERAGRASQVVREVRSLARDAAERRERGLLVAEGVHLAQEALKDPAAIRLALLSPRILRSEEGREVRRRLTRGSVPSKRVDDALLSSLGDVESHQGVLLILSRPQWREADLLSGPAPPRVLAACGVQDPGNLGALARIAEAAFCSGMVCAGAGADPFSPRSLRAGAGALLRLPVVEIASASEAALALRRLGFKLVGASPRGVTGYRDADLRGALALFVGSEGSGLPAEARERLDAEVRIPIRDGVESLNVAAAAAVILFEAAGRGGKG